MTQLHTTILTAPAKINLMLHVTGRRADGYHTLNTLIAFTGLGDTLRIAPAPVYSLAVEGPYAAMAPANDSNLVTRAVRLMEEACGRRADMAVTLTKTVPAGAGMGGGSADAAAMMQYLNAQWGHPLDASALAAAGVRLGAELPVCLSGAAQWVEGIGERLTPAVLPQRDAVVIWPGVVLGTRDVFALYRGPFSADMPQPADWDAIMRSTRNDLSDAAVSLAPAIGTAMAALKDAGGHMVRMTGSGSAVFGLFDSAQAAQQTAAMLAAGHPEWWVRPTRVGGP